MNKEYNNKYSDVELENLWRDFADVPIDEDERLEEDWFKYKKGTDKEDIWHWFDKKHSKGVYYLLYEFDMYNKINKINK